MEVEVKKVDQLFSSCPIDGPSQHFFVCFPNGGETVTEVVGIGLRSTKTVVVGAVKMLLQPLLSHRVVRDLAAQIPEHHEMAVDPRPVDAHVDWTFPQLADLNDPAGIHLYPFDGEGTICRQQRTSAHTHVGVIGPKLLLFERGRLNDEKGLGENGLCGVGGLEGVVHDVTRGRSSYGLDRECNRCRA